MFLRSYSTMNVYFMIKVVFEQFILVLIICKDEDVAALHSILLPLQLITELLFYVAWKASI